MRLHKILAICACGALLLAGCSAGMPAQGGLHVTALASHRSGAPISLRELQSSLGTDFADAWYRANSVPTAPSIPHPPGRRATGQDHLAGHA